MSEPTASSDQDVPPFVAPAWVASRRDRVRLVDCRWSLDGSQGREQYLDAHVTGAVHADLDRDLASTPSAQGGRHPLPTPAHFAAAMRRLGIDDDTVVVAHDTAGGVVAARLVWMLRILGHPAAVLDGPADQLGWGTTSGPEDVAPGTFTTTPWPLEDLADIDEVAAAADGLAPDRVVVDARDPRRHRGEFEPVDPRAGRIPGSRNVPVSSLGDDGRLPPPDDLRARFDAVGLAGPGRDVVWSCGSGVTACHGALAMEQAGLPRPRVFVGSYSAWSSDPARPVERG
ncbi:sulfurtransferase [Salsipaludibacter albus]|uniref:sulfurtransferase n=1 Tax=Salsipaludibacter albus TaxID=2849650 RepID=UPI001EE443D2|nr:sulfurtransferase [Salsipaludibacter albus]MBY5163978.1 sulfurtransferase [Salsipaludibacter albus]